MAVISKGIKLSYKNGTASDFVDLTNLQEIPELGGETESIEVTTLADVAHVYTDGLISYGDNLSFTFLYEKAQFDTLNGLEGISEWKVTLPDGASCTWSGSSSVKLSGAGVAAALGYTLNIKPNSEMIWA
mgnify:CR=1 FL=1